jgi:hypothetical protein
MPRGKREGKVTQKQMVSAALSDKGWEAKSAELQSFIKDKFNTVLAPNVISNYKSQLKSANGQGGAGERGGARRGRKPAPSFSDLETVRGLIDRLGAEQVKKLVDVAGMFA